MRACLVTQPYDDNENLYDFFEEVAADPQLLRLKVAVAWVKASGLERVRDQVATITARGHSSLVLGIDERGASPEGLHLAVELFDEVFVFHKPGPGTFHPKVYFAYGEERGLAFIGSNNLTAGGVYWNYEAAVSLDLELPADGGFLDTLEQYIDRLQSDAEICLRLTPELIDQLVADQRFGIESEAHRRRATAEEVEDAPEDDDSDLGAGDDQPDDVNPFGRSRFGRRQDPGHPAMGAGGGPPAAPEAGAGAPAPPVGGAALPPAVAVPAVPPAAAPAGAPVPPAVVRRWTKQMSGSDAQQRATANTRVTGNLKLTEAAHPIQHEEYFRHIFFGDATWDQTPKTRGVLETAEVQIDVVVDGGPLGVFAMTVDHADYRIADQSNVPTWLKWRDFNGYLRDHPHGGDWVSLERLADGTYRLSIGEEPTGPFM